MALGTLDTPERSVHTQTGRSWFAIRRAYVNPGSHCTLSGQTSQTLPPRLLSWETRGQAPPTAVLLSWAF